MPVGQGGPPSAAMLSQDQQMAAQAAQGQAVQAKGQEAGAAGESSGGANVHQLDAAKTAKQWANRISKLPPEQQQRVLFELRNKMPNMARLVEQLLKQMSPGQTAGDASQAMRPLPQAAPPQRSQGSGVI